MRSWPAGKVVRKEGFCEQRVAHKTGTDIRLRLNQSKRAGRDRPEWDGVLGQIACLEVGAKLVEVPTQFPLAQEIHFV